MSKDYNKIMTDAAYTLQQILGHAENLVYQTAEFALDHYKCKLDDDSYHYYIKQLALVQKHIAQAKGELAKAMIGDEASLPPLKEDK
jgi:hypothetical protein